MTEMWSESARVISSCAVRPLVSLWPPPGLLLNQLSRHVPLNEHVAILFGNISESKRFQILPAWEGGFDLRGICGNQVFQLCKPR